MFLFNDGWYSKFYPMDAEKRRMVLFENCKKFDEKLRQLGKYLAVEIVLKKEKAFYSADEYERNYYEDLIWKCTCKKKFLEGVREKIARKEWEEISYDDLNRVLVIANEKRHTIVCRVISVLAICGAVVVVCCLIK